MKFLALALVACGLLVLIYGGIEYNRQQTVVQVGSLRVTANEQKHVPLSPFLGGIALLGGLALLMAPRKRTSPSPTIS